MEQEKCNGWTNYETWRVNLEVFDGMQPDEPMTAEVCEEYVETMILMENPQTEALMILNGWARCFLEGVNWQEIADALNERIEKKEGSIKMICSICKLEKASACKVIPCADCMNETTAKQMYKKKEEISH
uniref:Uncharacterized protein n=1 Tax=viral metagenome TaxID=1070528 RepID=A0A6H1ZQQ1_9ZZZZ